MNAACQICDEEISKDIFAALNDTHSFIDTTVHETIYKLLPKFDDTMILCWFMNNRRNCNDLLFPIITDEGVCYTFNGISRNDVASAK